MCKLCWTISTSVSRQSSIIWCSSTVTTVVHGLQQRVVLHCGPQNIAVYFQWQLRNVLVNLYQICIAWNIQRSILCNFILSYCCNYIATATALTSDLCICTLPGRTPAICMALSQATQPGPQLGRTGPSGTNWWGI